MIKIQVPVTSANLGSGFDSLGIALQMYNNIYMEEYNGIKISSKDDVFVPVDEKNLIYSSAKRLYDICGKPFPGLKIEQENIIPMARGMGSSSACIVGGLIGANRLLGTPFKREELTSIAAKLEGHPDNVVPAILGGLTSSVIDGNKVYSVSIPPTNKLCFALMIPPFELKTSLARSVLKEFYSKEEAVFNISRASLTMASLFSGKFENLKVSLKDKIHQPYRMRLIEDADKIFDITYKLGAYGTYISGAGPTIASIINKEDAETFKANVSGEFKKSNINNWRIEILDVDYVGAKILDN